MKTLKIAMIAALIACTMVSLANADGIKENPKFIKVISLSLSQASQDPGLVMAIYQQVNKYGLLDHPQLVYVADVIYNGTHYRISATREQWTWFFRMQWEVPVKTKHKNTDNY